MTYCILHKFLYLGERLLRIKFIEAEQNVGSAFLSLLKYVQW